MSELNIKEIMAWCDRNAHEGHSLSMKFWGGGKYGSSTQVIANDVKCDEPEFEKLIEMLEEEVGYEWWHAVLFVEGEATYDPVTKAFRGEYTDVGNEDVEAKCDIEFRIPKTVDFDMMDISVRNWLSDIPYIVAHFTKSGEDVTTMYEEVIRSLDETLPPLIMDAVSAEYGDRVIKEHYTAYINSREEFDVDGDDLVYHMNTLAFSLAKIYKKEIVIDLQKLLSEGNIQ